MLHEKYLPKLLWNSERNGLRSKLTVFLLLLLYNTNYDLTQQAYLGFHGRDEKYY